MSVAAQRSRRREQREQVRAQILKQAVELLRSRPYRELTIDELMGSLGLTRTIFYRHFDDLPDLVVRLLEESGAELLEHERRVVQTELKLADLVKTALEAPVGIFHDQGPLLRAVAEAASHDEQIERGFNDLLGRFERLIESQLRAIGADRRLSDLEQTARALNLMNFYYLLEVFGTPRPSVSADVALRTLTEIWVGVLDAPTATESRRTPA